MRSEQHKTKIRVMLGSRSIATIRRVTERRGEDEVVTFGGRLYLVGRATLIPSINLPILQRDGQR